MVAKHFSLKILADGKKIIDMSVTQCIYYILMLDGTSLSPDTVEPCYCLFLYCSSDRFLAGPSLTAQSLVQGVQRYTQLQIFIQKVEKLLSSQ